MVSKKLLIPVIIVVVILGAVGYFLLPIIGMPAVVAQLVVDSGPVEIDTGSGWVSASGGEQLKQTDSVRTGAGAAASIVFFESSILRLDQNSQVTISELVADKASTRVAVDQEAGRTWSKVLKLSGIEDYEVNAPSTVASVRGTGFGVYMAEDGTIYIKLLEGSLSTYTYSMETGELVKIDEADIDAGQMVTIDLDLTILEGDLVTDDWVTQNQAMDDAYIEQQLNALLTRMSSVIQMGKSQYGVTDEEIRDSVRCWLKGECEPPPEMPQWVIDMAIRN
jgi:hypothetical protein